MLDNKLRLAVIDDDPEDMRLLKRSLGKIPGLEFTLKEFCDADGLPDPREWQDVDIIFLDYLLGVGTGLDILESIRNSGDSRPIIVLTGQGDAKIATALLESGADGYITKLDATPQVLENCIRQALTQIAERDGREVSDQPSSSSLYPIPPSGPPAETSQAETEPETSQAETEPETSQAEIEPETSQAETEPETSQAETEPETSQAETEPETETAEPQLKILLVEDDPGDARLVKRALGQARLAEFQLQHADCLEVATQYLQDNRFDVVLLDMSLPDGSGLDLLRRVCERCREIPVVVLTGNIDETLAEEAIAQGAQDYLLKDELVPSALKRVLRYAVGRQQARVQLQRAHDSLAEANELLGQKNTRLAELYETAYQFVDHVSHEFRTPLTVIREYATIIRDGLAGQVTDQQREFLGIIGDRTDDLANMVDDMLDVSKLEAGLLSVWRQETNLHDVLLRIRAALQQKASIKKVELEFALGRELPTVYCDPEKIGRVIINLAINAIKFCGEGGHVKIWTTHTHEDSEVIVGVTDNGPGITAENLQLIFERFQQVEGTIKRSTKGFGLGLSIAKELVGLNFGQMNVQSQPGNGSTFSFSVPVWNPYEVAKHHIKRVKGRGQPAARITLIIVDVEPDVESSISNEMDEFLQHAFRSGDAVMRISPCQWLVLVDCGVSSVDTLVGRVRAAWVEANRNLPGGHRMPEIVLDPKGTWDAETQADDILFHVCNELACAAAKPDEFSIHAIDSDPRPSAGVTAVADKTGAAACVLVVDDDRELLRGLTVRLEAAGYKVLTAADGKAAVDAALEHQPDAILMDNYMPEMSGLDALVYLRTHPTAKNIPVTMLSASLRDRDKALDKGARFFFQKPCPPETILAALSEVISQAMPTGVDE